MKKWIIALAGMLLVLFTKCQQQLPKGVNYTLGEKPYALLSQYQFFKGTLKNLEPEEGVLPYDLNSPLFSDYAHKARFVWMPDGQSATIREDGTFKMPPGSILIKNFYYQNDERDPSLGRRIMETRLLIQGTDKMEAHSYIWNDEQTEATLEIVGAVKPVSWIDAKGKAMAIDYVVPNKNQCKGCHYHDGEIRQIGPKDRNLNKDYAYAEGTKNQLAKWADLGYLSNFDYNEPYPSVARYEEPESFPLHDRAMAYLDINCGHCHNPHGPANTSGLNLIVDQPVNLKLGILKAPVASGKGSGGRPYSIVPGHPEESILLYRMQSLDPGAMMPELGRRTIHEEGIKLIEEWIASLE
ncbi:MAG: SO2930 family diheme c-type cytochrome [Bacteroidota bacterium]